MTPKTLKTLRIVSRVSFGSLIAIFLGGIFSTALSGLLDWVAVPLFLLSLLAELAYQFFSGVSERKGAKKKLDKFIDLPAGDYRVKDKENNAELGTLTNDEINYLRKKFLQNGMDDNDFYFNSMTFELFKKEEKPPAELIRKLDAILKLKDPVEITWSK
ncbi:MAG: hypothetical protein OEW15_08695 [Nitrospirota bacterium]|nr:hypothetical protein [Nitrospirota bacterium]